MTFPCIYPTTCSPTVQVFMGSPRWVHNPHLRARTAEALECLLPMHRVQQPGGNMIGMGGSFHREQLFTEVRSLVLWLLEKY